MEKKIRKSNNGTFFTIPVIVSGIILLIIFLSAVFAGQIAPYQPEENDYTASLVKAFSPGHILGTDRLGRDLFSRLLCGAQTSILNAFLIVAFEVVVGVPIGMLCGYYGGRLDAIVMRIWDIVCAVPSLLLAFVIVAAFGKGTYSGVLAIGIVYTPLTAKLARLHRGLQIPWLFRCQNNICPHPSKRSNYDDCTVYIGYRLCYYFNGNLILPWNRCSASRS